MYIQQTFLNTFYAPGITVMSSHLSSKQSSEVIILPFERTVTNDPEILLLSSYPKEFKKQGLKQVFVHPCVNDAALFTKASFTIAKRCQQPKFPSMNE